MDLERIGKLIGIICEQYEDMSTSSISIDRDYDTLLGLPIWTAIAKSPHIWRAGQGHTLEIALENLVEASDQ